MREQDAFWRLLVVVELGDEGFQYFLDRHASVGAREIGAVAPIVAVAEEEDLDASLPGVLMRGKNVGFLDALRVDALARLNMAERGEAVAKTRRPLVILAQGGLVHQRAQTELHLVALAGEEAERLVNQRAVISDRDLARARRAAALDLEEQARPRPALVIGVGAGPEQKGALKRVDRASHRARRCERTEILALAVARAARREELRHGVIAGDENEGEGLVVPEHHVVAGLQLLDEIGFEQKRLGLGRRGDEFHVRRVCDHAGDAVVVTRAPRVAQHPLLQMPRLADIEHLAGRVERAIDAGGGRRRRGMAAYDVRAGLDGAKRIAQARKRSALVWIL